MSEDGGEAGVGGWAGAFAFTGFEEVLVVEVVQEVLVEVKGVGWRSLPTVEVPGAEDLLHLRLRGTGGLRPRLLRGLMVRHRDLLRGVLPLRLRLRLIADQQRLGGHGGRHVGRGRTGVRTVQSGQRGGAVRSRDGPLNDGLELADP